MNKLRELLSVSLGFLLGAILLTPSLKSVIQSPYVWSGALILFYLLAFFSVCLLAGAFFITFWDEKHQSTVHRLQGPGNWISAFAYLTLLFYLGFNINEDRTSLPTVEDITISNLTPEEGELIKISAKVKVSDLASHKIEWIIDGVKQELTDSFLFYIVPKQKNSLSIKLKVTTKNNEITKSIELPIKRKITKEISNESKRTCEEQPIDKAIEELRKREKPC